MIPRSAWGQKIKVFKFHFQYKLLCSNNNVTVVLFLLLFYFVAGILFVFLIFHVSMFLVWGVGVCVCFVLFSFFVYSMKFCNTKFSQAGALKVHLYSTRFSSFSILQQWWQILCLKSLSDGTLFFFYNLQNVQGSINCITKAKKKEKEITWAVCKCLKWV